MRVILSRPAKKALKKLDSKDRKRIDEVLKGLGKTEPKFENGPGKSMFYEKYGLWKIRVGYSLRILYSIEGTKAKRVIVVHRLGQRESIYDNMDRNFKRR